MRKRKKIWLFLLPAAALAIFCAVIIQFNLRFMPFSLVNKPPDNTAANAALRQRLDQIYDTNFIFDTKSTVTCKIYLPRYTATDEETAALYGALFDFPGDFATDEDYYIFQQEDADRGKSLYIDQFFGHVLFRDLGTETEEEPEAAAASIQSNEDALAAGAKFMQSYHLDIPFENASLRFDGQQYVIRYIGQLDNYPNYAFPASLTIEPGGRVTQFEQFVIDYDRIDTVSLKTMKEAYLELPVDIDPGVRVDLKSCRIVYVFEESVVQPAYLFEGEMSGENVSETTFQCFVKAARYGAS